MCEALYHTAPVTHLHMHLIHVFFPVWTQAMQNYKYLYGSAVITVWAFSCLLHFLDDLNDSSSSVLQGRQENNDTITMHDNVCACCD